MKTFESVPCPGEEVIAYATEIKAVIIAGVKPVGRALIWFPQTWKECRPEMAE